MQKANIRPTGFPRITVIIACKNAARILPRCLDKLAQQTSLPHQIILKDALSSDGIDQLPEKYPTLSIHAIFKADAGIYDAWNQALEAATGDWILFLGADDILHSPDVLTRACACLADVAPAVDIAYGQVLVVDERGRAIELLGIPWAKAGPEMRHWMSLPHQGVFHRRSLFERVGQFDPAFRIVGDYELLRRTLPQSPAAYLSSLIVTDMRDGGISAQPKQALRLAGEMRKGIRRHGPLGWLTQMLTLRCAATYAFGVLLGNRQTIWLRQKIKRFGRS